MILYHGSNVLVTYPKILESDRALDFGKGFYLTSDIEQAKKWALLITKRRKIGKATVSSYEIKEEDLNILSILKFDYANEQWLTYIAKNRKKEEIYEKHDIIIGPVANDNTMPVITLYLRGDYDIDEAIKRLLTQRLKDQVVFKNEKSLSYLKFKGEINI